MLKIMKQSNFTAQIDKYTIEDCRLYLAQHPKGLMADYVRARLMFLQSDPDYIEQANKDEESFWKINNHSEDGIKEYMALFPFGKHIEECEHILKELRKKQKESERAKKEHIIEVKESIKSVIKVIGLIALGACAIYIIVLCIQAKQWPAVATLAPIVYFMTRLYEW